MLADLKFPLGKLRRSPGRTATSVLSISIVAGTSAAGSVRHPCADASVTRLDGTSISATRIDALVTHWMRTAHVTGVGIAVVSRGKLAYLKTYGKRNTARHLPFTPDSIITATSLTKPVFATLVMELVHQRIIALNTPYVNICRSHCPTIGAIAIWPVIRVTGRSRCECLVDQTSEFPNWRQSMQPIEELLNDHIFEPLGMTRSSMTRAKRFGNDYANGYDERGKSHGGAQARRPGDAAGKCRPPCVTTPDSSKLSSKARFPIYGLAS